MTTREQIEGAYIRWWPRGRRDEQRYIDGTMRDGRFVTIEHIGPTWSSRDGFIGDLVDVQTKGGLAFIDRPIPLRADPTFKPDEFRIESGGQTMHVVGVDFGSEPSRTVIATKCGRCDVTFQGDSNSELNYKIKAHHEVCPGPATSCHACGLKYDSSEADETAHRAKCPGCDGFVKAMERLAASIRKTAPATPREWVKPVVGMRAALENHVAAHGTTGLAAIEGELPAKPEPRIIQLHKGSRPGEYACGFAPGDLEAIRAGNARFEVVVTRDPTSGCYVPATPIETLPLDVITDARHDTVHTDIGPSRPARSKRAPIITGPAQFDATIGHGEPRITNIRPDGFDPDSIAAIKREMLKPVAKVKR